MKHVRPLTDLGFGALALALVFWPTHAVAQPVPLGSPLSVFPEDFGTIQTVRELRDGRLLVADPLGKALYAVDMSAGTRRVIGSEGQGPEEYMQPDAVWPLPGDSTLLIDLGNGRIVALGPDLEFGPTMPIAIGEPRPGSTLVLLLPQGIDAQGRIYVRAMGTGFGGELPDSAAILRVDRATSSVDTVASFKLQERKQTRTGGPNNQNVSISSVPLSPEDGWGVAPDGSVVLARSGDYHIERISEGGSSMHGAPVAFPSVSIRTAEKEEYVSATGRSGGGIGISVSVNNGSMQMNFSRGGGGQSAREIDQYEWPDTKPAFYSGRLNIDPMGRVWVKRHVDAGEPATYDLFGADGNHVRSVSLGNGKRVVGFGRGAVYVVAYDEFDLNYLEKYALPS